MKYRFKTLEEFGGKLPSNWAGPMKKYLGKPLVGGYRGYGSHNEDDWRFQEEWIVAVEETTLDKAKRLYPKGTRYKPAGRIGKIYVEGVSSGIFHEGNSAVWNIAKDDSEMPGYILYSGRWAEIIPDKPTEKSIEDCEFKVGDTVEIIESGYGCAARTIGRSVKLIGEGVRNNGDKGFKIDQTIKADYSDVIDPKSFKLIDRPNRPKYNFKLDTHIKGATHIIEAIHPTQYSGYKVGDVFKAYIMDDKEHYRVISTIGGYSMSNFKVLERIVVDKPMGHISHSLIDRSLSTFCERIQDKAQDSQLFKENQTIKEEQDVRCNEREEEQVDGIMDSLRRRKRSNRFKTRAEQIKKLIEKDYE